jgi:hypothetical protein
MDEKLELLLKTKAYSELTTEELKAFSVFGNTEEDYENLRHFFNQLEIYKSDQKFETHYMTKGSLDEVFETKFGKPGFLVKIFPPNKPFYLYPIVQIAAVLVVTLLIFQFVTTESTEQPIIAQVDNTNSSNKAQKEKVNTSKIEKNESVEKVTDSDKQVVNPTKNITTQSSSKKPENDAYNNLETDTKMISDSFSSLPYEEKSESNTFFTAAPTSTRKLSVSSVEQNAISRNDVYLQEDLNSITTSKKLKDKKSNSTVQPALFDLLTSVY